MEFIPYGRQSINSNDKKLVLKSLEANLITTGSYVAEFEKKLKKYFGTKYTLACSSATAGLHMAFLSIDIKTYDVVGIFNTKTIIGYATMLACLKMGATYTNIDEENPLVRIESIIDTCHPKILISENTPGIAIAANNAIII